MAITEHVVKNKSNQYEWNNGLLEEKRNAARPMSDFLRFSLYQCFFHLLESICRSFPSDRSWHWEWAFVWSGKEHLYQPFLLKSLQQERQEKELERQEKEKRLRKSNDCGLSSKRKMLILAKILCPPQTIPPTSPAR